MAPSPRATIVSPFATPTTAPEQLIVEEPVMPVTVIARDTNVAPETLNKDAPMGKGTAPTGVVNVMLEPLTPPVATAPSTKTSDEPLRLVMVEVPVLALESLGI